jgi:hypothetical protein
MECAQQSAKKECMYVQYVWYIPSIQLDNLTCSPHSFTVTPSLTQSPPNTNNTPPVSSDIGCSWPQSRRTSYLVRSPSPETGLAAWLVGEWNWRKSLVSLLRVYCPCGLGGYQRCAVPTVPRDDGGRHLNYPPYGRRRGDGMGWSMCCIVCT